MENINLYYNFFNDRNPLWEIKAISENDNEKLMNIPPELLNTENEWQQEYELIYLSHKLESN